MKKLFASFGGSLALMLDGKITDDDLRNGLFMFGCTRTHALSPGEAGECDERTFNKGRNAEPYKRLLDALLVAESDGRAGWIRTDMQTRLRPVDVLNSMLEKQAMPLLDPSRLDGYYHALPALRDAIQDAGISLDVVF